MTTNTLPPGSAGEGSDGEAASVGGPQSHENAVAVAPQWKLVWWGFRRHKLAVVGLFVTVAIYLVALFAGFLAPYSTEHSDPEYAYAPPQQLRIDEQGLYVYGYTSTQDQETLDLQWSVNEEERIGVRLFAQGEDYTLFGFIDSNIHLIGPADPGAGPMYLLGADETGHDMLSRIVHGTVVSMSIGLVGVAVALVLGVLLGGISGYFGGKIDTVIQRIVEFMMSIPTLPLWLALAAAIPPGWSPIQRYLAITVILSIIGWTSLARETRGRFLGLREEEFVAAAKVDGSSQPRIIFRHMLPSFTSHLIASLSLSVPGMILAETSLSFLGLGLQEPVVSWGVLLQESQNIRAVATAPWMMIPGLAVVVAVLSLNFLGDGLRDAADPYKN